MRSKPFRHGLRRHLTLASLYGLQLPRFLDISQGRIIFLRNNFLPLPMVSPIYYPLYTFTCICGVEHFLGLVLTFRSRSSMRLALGRRLFCDTP